MSGDAYHKLRPGWLAKDLAEAASDFAMSFSPRWLIAAGCNMDNSPVQPHLGDDDARRLREKLAARYREWTGRDLSDDLTANR